VQLRNRRARSRRIIHQRKTFERILGYRPQLLVGFADSLTSDSAGKRTVGVRIEGAESALTGSGRTSGLLRIADPGVPAALAECIVDSLADELADPVDASPQWDVSVGTKPFLPDGHTSLGEVIESVDPAGEDAEVVIYLTDLPRRDHTLPVIADVSPERRFALISVPGIGGTFITRRVRVVYATW
jgi:hypothetical protein